MASLEQIVSTRVIVESPSGIALLQRASTGEFQGAWELPGGKLELGEDPTVGVVRESREELGLEVELVNYHPRIIEERHILDGKHVGKPYRSLGFVATTKTDEARLSNEHVELRWLKPGEPLDIDTITPTSYKTLKKMSSLLLGRYTFERPA